MVEASYEALQAYEGAVGLIGYVELVSAFQAGDNYLGDVLYQWVIRLLKLR